MEDSAARGEVGGRKSRQTDQRMDGLTYSIVEARHFSWDNVFADQLGISLDRSSRGHEFGPHP